MLSGIVIKMLTEKAGTDVTSKAGADILRNDIEARTGEALSLNTVKRLVGVLAYNSVPREVTLDIIARYLGYKKWSQLQHAINDKISDFNISSAFIDLKDLPLQTELTIKWEPARTIRIRNKGAGEYIVICSINSKLKAGDRLILSQVGVGFPFKVKEVIREGASLGNYTAAQLDGVSSIEIING